MGRLVAGKAKRVNIKQDSGQTSLRFGDQKQTVESGTNFGCNLHSCQHPCSGGEDSKHKEDFDRLSDGDGDGDIESDGDGKKINKIWTFSFIGFFAGWSIREPNNIQGFFVWWKEMVVIILRKLGALSKIAFFSQYFWCFLWKEGAVVIPGRSVGKTNVQYRGLIRRTRPIASFWTKTITKTKTKRCIIHIAFLYPCFNQFSMTIAITKAKAKTKRKAKTKTKTMRNKRKKKHQKYDQVDSLWPTQPVGLGLTLSEMTRNKVTANFILPPPLAGPF